MKYVGFYLHKIHQCLQKLNTIYVVFILVFAILFVSIFTSFISNFFFDKKINEGFVRFTSIWMEILIGIFCAPIVETLIFQYAIIETVKKRFNITFACLGSAFLFSILHFYNIFYFLYSFIAGLLLAYAYCLPGNIKRGLILTLTVHITYNIVVMLLSHL